MPRLSNIEKLARDICWAELDPKPKGMTKAAHWTASTIYWRDKYRGRARWLLFIVKKLKPLRVLAMVDFK